MNKKRIINLALAATIVSSSLMLTACNNTNNNKGNNTNTTQSTNTKEAKSKLDITTDPFKFEDLLKENKPIILTLVQTGCPPCKEFHPVLNKMMEKYGDKITIRALNVREIKKGWQHLPIEATPTTYYFKKDGTAFVLPKELQEKAGEYFVKKTKDEKKSDCTISEGNYSEEVLESIIKEMIK